MHCLLTPSGPKTSTVMTHEFHTGDTNAYTSSAWDDMLLLTSQPLPALTKKAASAKAWNVSSNMPPKWLSVQASIALQYHPKWVRFDYRPAMQHQCIDRHSCCQSAHRTCLASLPEAVTEAHPHSPDASSGLQWRAMHSVRPYRC